VPDSLRVTAQTLLSKKTSMPNLTSAHGLNKPEMARFLSNILTVNRHDILLMMMDLSKSSTPSSMKLVVRFNQPLLELHA
jgi:hypothetical protein